MNAGDGCVLSKERSFQKLLAISLLSFSWVWLWTLECFAAGGEEGTEREGDGRKERDLGVSGNKLAPGENGLGYVKRAARLRLRAGSTKPIGQNDLQGL